MRLVSLVFCSLFLFSTTHMASAQTSSGHAPLHAGVFAYGIFPYGSPFVNHVRKCFPVAAAVGLSISSVFAVLRIMSQPSKALSTVLFLPLHGLVNAMSLQMLSSILVYPSYETCEELVKKLESMVPFVKELNGKLTATLQSPNGEEKLQMQCLVDEEASTDAYVNVLEETCTFKTIPQTST